MRQVTTVTNVYPFEQLAECIQDNVIEKLWDINTDYDWWDFDGLLELTQNEIDNMELTNNEIDYLKEYNLFDCTLKYFDLGRNYFVQVKVVVNDEKIFRKFLGIYSELWENCYYQFNSSGNSDTYLEITENDPYEKFTDSDLLIIESAENLMNYKILNILSILQDSYDYLTSRESIVETIICNEYEFTKEGGLF